MQVTAGGGAKLPRGTSVRVDYGGNARDLYVFAENVKDEHFVALCCEASAESVDGQLPNVRCQDNDPVGDAGAPGAILCSVWTNAPATITVNADGFVELTQNLRNRTRENPSCGAETVEARLTLGRPEGGVE